MTFYTCDLCSVEAIKTIRGDIRSNLCDILFLTMSLEIIILPLALLMMHFMRLCKNLLSCCNYIVLCCMVVMNFN